MVTHPTTPRLTKTRRPHPDSAFDTVEMTFGNLCAGPSKLTLDGRLFVGLPDRPLPLDELRSRLLHPSASYGLRDQVFGELIERARRDGDWMVGLAGMLLPGLRCSAKPLVRVCPDKAADIESEMLTSLVRAARQVTPGRSRLPSYLTWQAHTGARELVWAEMAECGRPTHHPVSAAPPQPWRHPDFVLADAVAQGVLCAEDADLIGDTRIGDLSLGRAAAVLGISYAAASKRRTRAEAALVEWITSDDYFSFDFVPKTAKTPHLVDGARSRQGRPRTRRPEQRQSDPSTRR